MVGTDPDDMANAVQMITYYLRSMSFCGSATMAGLMVRWLYTDEPASFILSSGSEM